MIRYDLAASCKFQFLFFPTLSLKGFAFSYFFLISQHALPSTAVRVLFILSVTLTSPLLVLNILFGSPLSIPTGLFDIREPAQSSLFA